MAAAPQKFLDRYAETRWEIVVSHEDGRKLHIGWSARHTQKAIFAAMRAHGQAICNIIPDEHRDLEWNASAKAFIGNGWRIGFGDTAKQIAGVY